MYPPVRRTRTDSHESGSEGQEDNRQQEMMERDPRAWGYPPQHFDDMRRQPFFDQRMYPEYEKAEEYRRLASLALSHRNSTEKWIL